MGREPATEAAAPSPRPHRPRLTTRRHGQHAHGLIARMVGRYGGDTTGVSTTGVRTHTRRQVTWPVRSTRRVWTWRGVLGQGCQRADAGVCSLCQLHAQSAARRLAWSRLEGAARRPCRQRGRPRGALQPGLGTSSTGASVALCGRSRSSVRGRARCVAFCATPQSPKRRRSRCAGAAGHRASSASAPAAVTPPWARVYQPIL
jgi:hypothetical protein